MKKIKAYFEQGFHGLFCNQSGYVNGCYTIDEPWFRIGKLQIWRTIKIACCCGKVFYDINNE